VGGPGGCFCIDWLGYMSEGKEDVGGIASIAMALGV
jgi:hypothetical protein